MALLAQHNSSSPSPADDFLFLSVSPTSVLGMNAPLEAAPFLKNNPISPGCHPTLHQSLSGKLHASAGASALPHLPQFPQSSTTQHLPLPQVRQSSTAQHSRHKSHPAASHQAERSGEAAHELQLTERLDAGGATLRTPLSSVVSARGDDEAGEMDLGMVLMEEEGETREQGEVTDDDVEWGELMEDMEKVLDELEQQRAKPWFHPISLALQAHIPGGSDSSSTPGRSSLPGGSTSSSWVDQEAMVLALREGGYNAAVCITGWSQSPGLPAGSHSFIDILPGGSAGVSGEQRESEATSEREATSDVREHEGVPERLVIEPEFASQFDLVKMTPSYRAMLSRLPRVFVGSEKRLLDLLELLIEAMRMSLSAYQLPVAPWRRTRYMSSKWTAVTHRRTFTLQGSSSSSSSSPSSTGSFLESSFGIATPKTLSAPNGYPLPSDYNTTPPASDAFARNSDLSHLLSLSLSCCQRQAVEQRPYLALCSSEPALLSSLAVQAAKRQHSHSTKLQASSRSIPFKTYGWSEGLAAV